MKPIFKEEKIFLEQLLNIELPDGCWRKAHAIYLDMDSKDPLLRFKVDNGEAFITKNNLHKKWRQKGINYHLVENMDNITSLVNKSQEFIRDYILSNPGVHQYVLGYSSGKDSIVNVTMWLETLKKYPEVQDFMDKNNIKWEIQMANTSNDTPDTYKNVKNVLPEFINRYGYGVTLNGYSGLDLIYSKNIYEGDRDVEITILNPSVGFYQWIVHEKDYFIPTVMVRNCCSTYKEGQTDKFYPKDKKVVIVSGVRKFESFKRAKYDYVMDNEFKLKLFKTNNFPKDWVQLAPIVEWYNEDIWLYLLGNPNIPFNPMYKLGFHRVGCIFCPFSQNYIDLIIQKHYPEQWDRWMGIVEKNYEKKNIENTLKWSLGEYQNGKWKTGISKVYEITSLKETPERVTEVAEIMNISEDMAKRYFQRVCGECGKKLNPGEVGMFLKTQGRYENQVDDRNYLCKKHLSEMLGISGKEYVEMRIKFTEGGCDLF